MLQMRHLRIGKQHAARREGRDLIMYDAVLDSAVCGQAEADVG